MSATSGMRRHGPGSGRLGQAAYCAAVLYRAASSTRLTEYCHKAFVDEVQDSNRTG